MNRPRWLRADHPVGVVGPVVVAAAALFLDDWPDAVQLPASLAGVAALPARRRFPIAVLLVNLVGLATGPAWVAGVIALYSVATRHRGPWLLGGCVVAFAITYWLPYPITRAQMAIDLADHYMVLRAFAFGVAAVAIGRLVTVGDELRDRLAELTRSRAREDALLAERVLATERARLAREMHDVVAHQVSLISLQAGALQVADVDPREAGGAIRDLAVRTLVELRHMVGVLRAAGGHAAELTPQPTLADVPRLVDGCDADLDLDGAECSEPVERAAFRVVQESLTNARKHAPGARPRVRVRVVGDRLRVEVRNGPPDHQVAPLNLPGGGHGLVGLQERVHLLGGDFHAGPTADGGYLVTASLPKTG
ncbi:histidine kinase [Saccharothrix sp. NPDC042600]|uniref:sensor histidine kinase n=1 Tax=Saccharothrix TaxID=2071 RepID=UPI0033EABC3F|nr:histidine kinase [Saccharothrix mutabilis subsp. capreolus]